MTKAIFFALSACLGPAACTFPSTGYYGVPSVEREVEGSRFSIRVREDVAEVIRTSPEFPARYPVIAARAQKAVHLETGCSPEWVTGDPAMLWVGLSCDGAAPPKRPRRGIITWQDFE